MIIFTRARSVFLIGSVVQLMAVFERQVFDFMGYMWLCIGVNFLHVICVILGMFGALQHRSCYVVLGIVWNLLWMGWNAFIVCLYFDVGVLHKEMEILNLGTRTSNWWLANGPGCVATYNFSVVDPITFKPAIVRVENCWLDYQYVEIIQSLLQLILSICAFACGMILVVLYRGKDASSFEDSLKPLPVPGYSLSLQHSVLDDRTDFTNAKAALGLRDASYETVSRKGNGRIQQHTNGTVQSAHSYGSSVRRPTSKSTRAASQNGTGYRSAGVDSIRVSTRMSNVNRNAEKLQELNGNFPFLPCDAPRQPPGSLSRAQPLYIPGSVSPYHSRNGTEVSF